jgi:hypothetical protein
VADGRLARRERRLRPTRGAFLGEQVEFSTSRRFGDVGDVFVAETGSFVPVTGAFRFTGYKVVRVDGRTGAVSDFIVNTGDNIEEVIDPDGFNKPIDVKFLGDTMLIVDFGVFEPGLGKIQRRPARCGLVSRGRMPRRPFG